MPTSTLKRRYPTVSSNQSIQAMYEQLRDQGQSHAIADVCAHRHPPGTGKTDRAFQQRIMEDPVPHIKGDKWKEQYIREAKAAGISTDGKRYLTRLADKRGAADPEAWVSDIEDVKRVARKRNMNMPDHGIHGHIVHTPDTPLAEDIIARHMKEELAVKPKADQRELREKIIDQHAMKWSD